jgi:predicted nucleic acid-binding protein
MILLDTNILSEVMKPAPAAEVDAWLGAQPVESLFISAVTEAELRFGLALLPEGRRRERLVEALEGMLTDDFADRILPFDSAAASAYARISADRRRIGRPISQFDAQIAATAWSRNATLATRNIGDFEGCGVRLVDPWRAISG